MDSDQEKLLKAKNAELEKQLAAKNRDLEIEAALEKVRSRSLAMHKSEELHEVVTLLAEKLQELDVNMEGAVICLPVEDKRGRGLIMWSAMAAQVYAPPIFVPYQHPSIILFSEAWEKGTPYIAKSWTYEEKTNFWEWAFEHSDFKYLPEHRKNQILGGPAYALSTAFSKNSAITIPSHTGRVLSDQDSAILKRFAKVFDQAYIRFLDLQKAEAQARESQIQLALERVRARTMAMQKSEELAETAYILFQQFKGLGENPDQATIGIINEEEWVIEYWVTMYGSQVNKVFKFSIDEPNVTNRIYKAWKKQQKSLMIDLTGKELDDFTTYRARMGGAVRKKTEKRRVINVAFFSKGLINVQSTEARSAESICLLERFAGVFDGTYTRFLDLKRAEAQAREAQIEAALEKVRSRSLAMHQSDELRDLVKVVFEKLQELDFALDGAAFIATPGEASKEINLWIGDSHAEYPTCFKTPFYNAPVITDIFDAVESGSDFFSRTYSADEKNPWFEYAFKHTDYKYLPDELKSWILAQENLTQCFALAKNSGVGIHFHNRRPLSENEIDILKRFSKVFEQTYTRFLDLKQAEAQARESQIQLALERVRARTMAMRHSSELQEASLLLFQQAESLGVKTFACGFNIWDDDRKFATGWMGTVQGLEPPFKTDSSKDVYLPIYKAAKKGELLFVIEQGGKELEAHYGYLATIPTFSDVILKGWTDAGLSAPTFQIIHCAYFAQGYLMFISYESCPEAYDIFKRFAKVFEQTYTRFLDLQKAEEQAREGQIQLGLERVRAQAMAMQTSEELNELIGTVFTELTKLDFVLTRCLIMIFDPETKASRWWMANSEAPAEPMNYLVQNHKNPAYDAYLKAWKERDLKWNYALKGKVKRDWDDFLFVDTELAQLPGPVIEGMKAPDRVLLSASFNNFGCLTLVSLAPLSAEHSDIMLRFAKVFDMSYTRFNDLKQAEIQAREARIETSLERVRSAAMAMHDSAGVGDATALVFTELYKLGISTIRCGVCIVDGPAKEIEVWSASQQESKLSRGIGKLDMTAHPLWGHLLNAWKDQKSSFVYELKGKGLTDYYHIIRTASGYHAPDNKAMYNPAAGIENETQYCNCYIFKEGCLFTFTHEPFLTQTGLVLEKFAAVFGLTYRRYLDLQKAEAQVREAQIEAALERVRSKTMAMHNSNDVGETVTLMFNELIKLGVDKIARCGIAIPDNNGLIELWTAKLSKDEKEEMIIGHINTTIHPMLRLLYDAWKSKQPHFEYVLEGDDLDSYITALNNYPGYPIKYDKGAWGAKQYHNDFFFHEGMVFAFTFQPLSAGIAAVFKRFSGVFGQTYRRFLDLQKAEAQAREARIETSLERVRSRTMAMQKSEELAEVIQLVYDQLCQLDFNIDNANFVVNYKESDDLDLWLAVNGQRYSTKMHIPYLDHPIFNRLNEAKAKGLSFFSDSLTFEEKNTFFRHFFENTPQVPQERKKAVFKSPGYARSVVLMKTIALCIQNYAAIPYSDAENEVLVRFGKVFEQTYTRFNDLKQAEEQAREATIEAALERVRSKTMAMHNSQDVGDTVGVMFHEFVKLGIEKMIRCGIGIMSHESRTMELWTAKWGENEKVNLLIGHLDMTIHKMLGSIYDAWKSKQSDFAYQLAGSDLVTYAKAINSYPDYPLKYDLNSLPQVQIFNDFFFNEGVVFAFTTDPLSDEIVTVLKRFAGVFGQTYRRYLDLQKAEAAAREAQIEAALERVRSKAMAMRSSGDVNATANTVFIELRKLDVDLVRCGLGLMEKESHISTIHAATNSVEGGSLEVLGNIDMNIHPVLEGIYNQWRQNKDYFPVLEEESLRTYYEKLHESGISVPEWKSGEKQYGYFLQFAYGSLYAWSGKQESEITIKTLKRFTSVIGLTYTRYIELQKAESNTKEAIKQASLDRVRAEIASMRKRSDLERITPLIWDELTILGIPFIRCGVFIMDEEQKLIHTFLSTPDGKAIGAFHIPFDTSGNFEIMVDSWRHKEPYIDHWKEEAFSQFADALVKQGAIASKAQYMRTLPHEGVHLNFLPFLQGMLYVGNVEPLAEDNIDLIQAVADAFSTAYARYEDFNKLEAAKQQVDNTLIDLKAAQTKLIQSEKMASLGELTAGIAHEIQNPLNFVNNFSEVNQEMIDELEEELKAGNIEEALAIAADIKQNEEKISHHGKRADGIVKGMLQHSRTGGGEKQLTNMNTLADEFLRLSYHGLRAKDKAFNAEMVTHFDPDLPKISVIAQDMGRVLLNLFNNAFYAVNQKKKTAPPDYKPEVSVTTSTENGQVIIKVKDNGVGIPEHVKAKIMQPFFTTKPTGEGTGLGLSLTYDMVVKGHGGKIEVNSTEGEGSEFIISLPSN